MAAASGAAQVSSAANAASSAASNAAGGGKEKKKKGKDDDSEEESDDEPNAKEKTELQVWEWFDDLMEGFAEIYRMTVGAGHSCNDGVRKCVYPIKERLLDTYDAVDSRVNPRPGQGDNSHAPVFAHE
mmetsp:Transcript_101832/g.255282  ORF Transcript_101832/g.255282 Transcript_101832/m.255282 type:complete len:128 (-) Transcript_101832:100-483(-)